MKPSAFFLVTGALFAGIGVALGAFGSHGLKTVLSPQLLDTYETAVRYQMYHAFALLAAGLAAQFIRDRKLLVVSGWCFIAGTVLFSGSLFTMTLTGARWLGAVTPFGGVAFIAGWVLLGYSVWNEKHGKTL